MGECCIIGVVFVKGKVFFLIVVRDVMEDIC